MRKASRAPLPKRSTFHVPYRVVRDRLPNGLRVCVVETPHLHSAVVALYARAGGRFETPRTNGLSHFLEHMLFRGSARYPSSYALNRAIEERGGTLYAETGRDHSLYQIGVNPVEIPAALEILGDLFTSPTFRDIELERPIVLEEILEDLDDGGRNVNAHDISRALIWPKGHPLGQSVIGPEANVRRFTTADVRRHFRRFYGARNMVLCVAGRVKHETVRGPIATAFGRVSPGQRVEPRPARPGPRGPQIRFVRDDTAQVQMQLVFRGVPEVDPDFPALATLLRLTDDGMSTPLHYRVADRRGLAYHVGAGVEALHDATLFEVEAACSPAKLPDLLGEVLAILDELRTRPVDPGELDKAKRRYIADLEAGVDDIDGLCGWFGGTELFFRPYSHEERTRRMLRVTAGDVQRVAARILRGERLTFVAVGPVETKAARQVRASLRQFGGS